MNTGMNGDRCTVQWMSAPRDMRHTVPKPEVLEILSKRK